MQTIQQLLFDAVKYEERFLAHAVYLAVQDGHAKLQDSAEGFDFDQLDLEKAKRMAEENILAMSLVKLYAMPTEPGCFAFVLAENEKDAGRAFIEKYRMAPRKVLDMWMEMDRSLYYPEKNKSMSFREIKNQVQTFPYFVCEFQKERKMSA